MTDPHEDLVEAVANEIRDAGMAWLEENNDEIGSLGWADIPDEVFSRAVIALIAERTKDATPEMPAWQPIKSAPKDRQILAVAEDEYGLHYYGVAEWATAKPTFNSISGWFWPYAIRPTHWIALPAPPKEKA